MNINGIDKTDNRIIDLLLEDGRMSYSEIADRVGLSRTAVKNRIDALEKSGVIKGYTAILDIQSIPQSMTFITTIETEPNYFDEVVAILKTEPCVLSLCQTAGDSSLHAVCVASDPNELRTFAKRIRTQCKGLKKFHANNVWEIFKGNIGL